MSKPKSDTLFRFTSELKYLEIMLLEGLFPRYCLEDMNWFGMKDQHAYPMICFCDIPLSIISEHTSFYGNYGIGLTKEWAIKNNINPVIYSHQNGIAASVVDHLFKEADISTINNVEKEERSKQFFLLYKLIKPLSGEMYNGSMLIQKEFYQENEWRYTPDIIEALVSKDIFDSEKETLNKNVEKFKLNISASDIKYIFVKDDSEIPPMVDFININLDKKYSGYDLKLLISRIISLQTVMTDL